MRGVGGVNTRARNRGLVSCGAKDSYNCANKEINIVKYKKSVLVFVKPMKQHNRRKRINKILEIDTHYGRA